MADDDMDNFPDLPEEKNDPYDELDIYIFFNKLQSPWQNLFVDIRDANIFNEWHPRYTINIPVGIDSKEMISILKKDIESQQNIIGNVYIYTNKHNNDHYSAIAIVLKEQFNMFPKFYTFNDKNNMMQHKYPFLCVDEKTDANNEQKQNPNAKANKYRQLLLSTIPKNTNQKKKRFVQLYSERIGYHLEYPDQIINDRLFLGDYNAASRKEIVKNLGITHIVNCTKINNEFQDDKELNIKYCKVSVNDADYEPIAWYFDRAITFIDAAMKENDKNKILIHCAAGVSRSSTITIVYLMKCNSMSMDVALQYVQERRSCINPNEGFKIQLQHYEENGFKIDEKKLTKRLETLY